jgi:hypothetical protein
VSVLTKIDSLTEWDVHVVIFLFGLIRRRRLCIIIPTEGHHLACRDIVIIKILDQDGEIPLQLSYVWVVRV